MSTSVAAGAAATTAAAASASATTAGASSSTVGIAATIKTALAPVLTQAFALKGIAMAVASAAVVGTVATISTGAVTDNIYNQPRPQVVQKESLEPRPIIEEEPNAEPEIEVTMKKFSNSYYSFEYPIDWSFEEIDFLEQDSGLGLPKAQQLSKDGLSLMISAGTHPGPGFGLIWLVEDSYNLKINGIETTMADYWYGGECEVTDTDRCFSNSLDIYKDQIKLISIIGSPLTIPNVNFIYPKYSEEDIPLRVDYDYSPDAPTFIDDEFIDNYRKLRAEMLDIVKTLKPNPTANLSKVETKQFQNKYYSFQYTSDWKLTEKNLFNVDPNGNGDGLPKAQVLTKDNSEILIGVGNIPGISYGINTRVSELESYYYNIQTNTDYDEVKEYWIGEEGKCDEPDPASCFSDSTDQFENRPISKLFTSVVLDQMKITDSTYFKGSFNPVIQLTVDLSSFKDREEALDLIGKQTNALDGVISNFKLR